MAKYVYLFSEADGDRKDLFGGKGANLAEMTNLGLPIPQGFTVTTEFHNYIREHLDKSSVGIIGKSLIACLFGKALYSYIV